MLGRKVMEWMFAEDRGPRFLSDATGMDPGRLIGLITGNAVPTDEELVSLSAVTGIPEHDLRVAPGEPTGLTTHDPMHCYSVAEAAALLGISEDTVRKEVRNGVLYHVVLGARALRIPRFAIEARLTGVEPVAIRGTRDRDSTTAAERFPGNAGNDGGRPARTVSDAPTATPLALF